MRVLAACSLGGAGHLQPLRPLLDAARRRGHETLVVGPPAIAEMATGIGHPFTPGGEPPEAEVAPIRERLPMAAASEASVLGNRELFGRLATTAMLPAMVDVVGSWAPDLIVRDPCEYASAVVAHTTRARAVQAAIGLAAVEWASIDVAAPALEDHAPGLTAAVRTTAYLSRFPASLDPSPFATTKRFREGATTSGRRPGAPSGRAPRRAVVYVSFGTVLGHMSIAAEVYRTMIDAVAGLDAEVLMTVGHRFDPSQLGPLPHNVRVESWVDQTDALGAADLVVCHGGSGTAFGSLAAGVPVVIVPLFADQFANAAAIVGAGAGLAVASRGGEDGERPLGGDAAHRIAEAIDAVRADPAFRAAARRMAGEMRRSPEATDLLDELLGRP